MLPDEQNKLYLMLGEIRGDLKSILASSSGTALSLRRAQALQDAMAIALGLRDRGVKTAGGDGRGGLTANMVYKTSTRDLRIKT